MEFSLRKLVAGCALHVLVDQTLYCCILYYYIYIYTQMESSKLIMCITYFLDQCPFLSLVYAYILSSSIDNN